MMNVALLSVRDDWGLSENINILENIIKILLHTHIDSDFSHKSNEGSHRQPHSYPILNEAFTIVWGGGNSVMV